MINYVPASDYIAMQNDPEVETFVSDLVYVLKVQPSVKDEEPQPITVNGEEVEGNPLQTFGFRGRAPSREAPMLGFIVSRL